MQVVLIIFAVIIGLMMVPVYFWKGFLVVIILCLVLYILYVLSEFLLKEKPRAKPKPIPVPILAPTIDPWATTNYIPPTDEDYYAYLDREEPTLFQLDYGPYLENFFCGD